MPQPFPPTKTLYIEMLLHQYESLLLCEIVRQVRCPYPAHRTRRTSRSFAVCDNRAREELAAVPRHMAIAGFTESSCRIHMDPFRFRANAPSRNIWSAQHLTLAASAADDRLLTGCDEVVRHTQTCRATAPSPRLETD